MNKARADRSICRYCKQREPQVIIRKIDGLPLGECKTCNTKRQLDTRRRKRFALGLYSDTPELVSAVHKTLAGLGLGAYPVLSNITREQIGYLIVQNGSIFLNTWNESKRFEYRLFEVASVLGNQNLFIDSQAIQVLDHDGKALNVATIGLDLPLLSPADAMVWFNPSLLNHAVSLVRDELKQSKANRSKNPKPKIDLKGAE